MITTIQNNLVRFITFLGAAGVILLMLHVCADVAMRHFFNKPIPATVDVVSRYYMVLIAFLPLAWVEREGGMIHVALLESVLPNYLIRISDLLVGLLSAALYALLFWITFKAALSNFDKQTFIVVLNTKFITWPSYFLPPLGFFLASIVVALRILSLCSRSVDNDAPLSSKFDTEIDS